MFEVGKAESDFWSIIQNDEQLEEAISISKQKPILVFKHSERCSISRFVKRRLESQIKEHIDPSMKYYLIHVVENRNVSQMLAQKMHVQHESPQLLHIVNGHCVAHDSHDRVHWPMQ